MMANETWNLSDPYVYQALKEVTGQTIAVQTIRGSVRGQLEDVMPDHLVVVIEGTPFFIRMEQIIWVNPL